MVRGVDPLARRIPQYDGVARDPYFDDGGVTGEYEVGPARVAGLDEDGAPLRRECGCEVEDCMGKGPFEETKLQADARTCNEQELGALAIVDDDHLKLVPIWLGNRGISRSNSSGHRWIVSCETYQ